jgi:NADH:ubiquinone oxidoreductase subunit 6 (subunit J)
MSDIAIRLDGLFLGAFLIFAASVYFVVGFVAAVMWLKVAAVRQRSREVARTSAFFGTLCLTALAVLVLYLTSAPPTVSGPDWLDRLCVPALLLFLFGCFVVARRRSAPHS